MKLFLVVMILSVCALAQVRKETLAQLEKVTAAKHLHFEIGCVSSDDDPEEEFIAYANIPGHDSLHCVEEGGKSEWAVTKQRTQQAAAEALIEALKWEPTLVPRHCEPAMKMHKHRQCPRPIRGGLPE